jgi:hypothetical protein
MSEISRGVITSESDFRVKIDAVLEPHFYLYREVIEHEGRLRIDYILQCKKSNVFFGLEVKRPNLKGQKKRGRDWGAFMKQAANYAKKYWFIDNYLPFRVPIFTIPSISKYFIEVDIEKKVIIQDNSEYYPAKHKAEHSHSNVNSLIGTALGVGEVRGFKPYTSWNGVSKGPNFGFYFNNFEIWHSYRGLHQVNYQKLTQNL